jgi:hypothetical protein
MTVRIVWTAYRSGLPVELADWRPPASSGFVLHRVVLHGKSPDTDDGVTYPFVAAGCTDYVLLAPRTPGDGFPMAAPPDPALPTAVLHVPAPAFNKAIFPLEAKCECRPRSAAP